MEKRTMGRWFYGVLVVLMGLMCFLFWKQITVSTLSEALPYYSDMPPYLQEGVEAKTDLWYALIGPLVFAFYQLTGTESGTSFLFALALSAANGATVLLVRHWYCLYYKMKSNIKAELLSLNSIFVSMLLFPSDLWATGWWYRGSFSPNVWHNPTSILCRPFSLWVILCVYQMLLAYRENRPIKKYMLQNMAAAFLSMWAKPSFLVVFLPVLCLYLLVELIKTKGQSFWFSVKLGLSFAPSMLVVLYQYLQLFLAPPAETAEASGICFGMLQSVPRMAVVTITSSLFLIFAAVLVFIYRKEKRMHIFFAGLGYAIAWIMALFVEETGIRAGHGNFSWSFILILFCLFAYMAGECFINSETKKIPPKILICLLVIYSAHCITGVCYFAKILCGGSYY